jgi:aspartyl-tRNA(Asn)/glutamyl-tRNA(Gln) amidotransferase subunit A
VTDWTAGSLAEAIKAKKLSPIEVVREYLYRIARLDSKLRSFITVDAEGALARARALEKEPPRGPLHGIPLAYKDLCVVRGLPTSCGTRTPDYFRFERECTAVTRLSQAGAVTLGKLNMSELAMAPSVTTPTTAMRKTRGAWATSRADRRAGPVGRSRRGSARALSAATRAARSDCPRPRAGSWGSSRPMAA